jgi:small subunit ribosomal protein S16
MRQKIKEERFERNMLAIRLQRTGRKGHAMFRVVVQDSRRTPTSGKIVAQLGTYDPHAKTVTLDGEKASFYLSNGAQPSPRVTRLLQGEGVQLPSWVATSGEKSGAIRNPDKLRRNQQKEEAVSEPTVAEEEPAAVSAE